MKKICLEKVLEILNLNMDDTKITAEQIDEDLSNLGMDSIIFIQIVVSLEENFDCEIPDSKLIVSEMNTLRKMLVVLTTLYEEQNDLVEK